MLDIYLQGVTQLIDRRVQNPEHFAFLLLTPEADLVSDLSLGEDEFRSLAQSVALRGRFHLNVVQPLMDAAHRKLGRPEHFDLEQISAALGRQKVALLKDYTDNVYRFHERASAKNRENFIRLRTYLETTFGKRVFSKIPGDVS